MKNLSGAPELSRHLHSGLGPRHPSVVSRFPKHFRRLQSLLLKRGRTREQAEDLIQDAFVKMQEYCEKGGHVEKPEGFLVRTALRLAMNARRDEHRDLYVDKDPDELTYVLDPAAAPDEVVCAEQCLNRMREALDAVSRRTRDVFFMHRLDGLSYAQIAAHFGVSVSAIEKHMATALAKLTDASLDL